MPVPGEITAKHPIVEKIIEENKRSENKNQGAINLDNAKFSIGNSRESFVQWVIKLSRDI